MSNIYITEPATNGKVILTTTVGDIEIELWSKETPLASKNFVQLCMEGYYDDTAFHRLVKGFIVQGGDPTGTGEGGESIYGAPFKTESHTRLSFNRRGLLGMACPEPNCNGSQFFFTLGEALELNGKHTLFGRVVGNTLFNMLRLADVEVVNGDRPTRLHRILKTTVILNPYDDIVPQAEEEEEIITKVEEKLRSRGKSAHDLVNDEKLSKETVSVNDKDAELTAKALAEMEAEAEARKRRRDLAARLQTEEEMKEKEKRMLELKAEADAVRRDIAKTMRSAKERAEAAKAAKRQAEVKIKDQMNEEEMAAAFEAEQRDKAMKSTAKAAAGPALMVESFAEEANSYRKRLKKNKEIKDREDLTMSLLNRFQSRLQEEIKKSKSSNSSNNGDNGEVISSNDPTAWLGCTLLSDEPAPARKVLDPALENPDRYDLYDPRNPLNVRKRMDTAAVSKNGDRSRHKRRRPHININLSRSRLLVLSTFIFCWLTLKPLKVLFVTMRYVAIYALTIFLFVFLCNAQLDHHGHSHASSESPSHGHSHSHSEPNHEKLHSKPDTKTIWMDTVSAVFGISLAPCAILLLVPDLNKHNQLLKVLLAFAAGGLLGDAFLHLIPHALSYHGVSHDNHDVHSSHGHSHSFSDLTIRVFLCVIGGIFGFLCIDKTLRFLRGGHDHSHSVSPQVTPDKKAKNGKSGDKNGSNSKSKPKRSKGIATTGYLNLAADFTHNFTDGIAIAGSFLISRNVGFVTTLTVLIHELPHEIGDYAILIKSGCGVYRAMLLQLLTAFGALLGASLSLLAAGVGMDGQITSASQVLLSPELITTCLLPFTAGGFIYIALVSVLPDLLAEQHQPIDRDSGKIVRRIGQGLAEFTALILGVGLMAAIGLFE
nr:peptidyl prolyl cis trans isomerase CWC27 [Hymenolepis microstoma]